MPMSPRLLRPIASGVHPEAAAWRSAVVANGGSVSASTMKAVSTFCASVDAQGLRSKLVRVNLMCGSNLNAVLVPLFRATSRTGTQLGNATDTNTGDGAVFVSDNYNQASGLLSVAGNRWLRTGLTQSFSAGKHIGCFVHTRAATVFRVYIGAQDSTTPGVGNAGVCELSSASSNTQARMRSSGTSAFTDGTGGPIACDSNTMLMGVTAGSGAGNTRVYADGAVSGTTGTGFDNSFSTADFAIFGAYEAATNSVVQRNECRIGGYTIGLNLTDGEVLTYSTIWDTFLKALGRR